MLDAATVNNSGANENIESQNTSLKRKRYINAINYANFNNDPLQIIFEHKIFARKLSMFALPSPCMQDSLELSWVEGNHEEELEQFECLKVLIPNGEHVLSIIPDDYCHTPEGMTISLPLRAQILNNRQSERYSAVEVEAILTQNGSFYEGNLVNFNTENLLVALNEIDNPELRWINRDAEFHVMLKKQDETVYTGSCVLTSTREYNSSILHTFQILDSRIRRFKKKKYRGERFELQSPVQISFMHPLSTERCRIQAVDISASGLGLIEDAAHSVLIPGLKIPEMEMNLPGGTPLRCSTQIIYKQIDEERDSGEYRYGMALLDMDPGDHSLLLNFVHQANDSRTSVCASVDSSALWKFFFESGFIYPEKYKHLSNGKNHLKELYDRLYTKSPGIARHFIYQQGTRIQGHMSMLRSYENSWLLHHHAAASINSQNAGLHVLNQVGSFINNSYRIRSLRMLYLMCYYREDNRFPKRVFGDIATNADNKAQLSLDTWAYFHCYRDAEVKAEIQEGWSLDQTTAGDLRNLESFYQHRSGGLMLKAMNLSGGGGTNDKILGEYAKSGFKRSIQLFSINFGGECRGIIMADQSETGLNMSNLTNSIKVFIINPEGLTRDIIHSFIHEVSDLFTDENRIPVLMYPENSAVELDLPKEKSYTLWILNAEASDAYFKHLKTLLKKINH